MRIKKLAALTAAVLTIPLAACGAGDAGGGGGGGSAAADYPSEGFESYGSDGGFGGGYGAPEDDGQDYAETEQL